MDNEEAARNAVWQAIDLTKNRRYREALPLFEEHLAKLTSTLSDKRLAAAAFSFYGLCVAKIERKYSQAVEYCKTSLKADRFDANHRENLAKVYMEADDRKRAVEALREGLSLDPQHRGIHQLWREIGRRKPPMLSFLPRSNPINIWLGRILRPSKHRDG